MSYAERRERLASWLRGEALAACLIEDREGLRNPSLRYLCGHPEDACLFVLASGRAILVPWDANLARSLASADEIIPFTDFDRDVKAAFAAIARREGLSGRVELSGSTAHTLVEGIARASDAAIVCREGGLDQALAGMRALKESAEIASLRAACAVTNGILRSLQASLGEGGERTEAEVAQFVERGALEAGAEGMSFRTIAAGPARSFGIHAFPSYGNGPFGGEGLSILDFGVLVGGYPSDVTVTLARGRLSAGQEEMVGLVEEAYDLARSLLAPGRATREIALAVDSLFRRRGYAMPHSLGHGLGLEIHEAPRISGRETNASVLAPGMVVTIEPGLYDAREGGVRKENDFLVTESGFETLTEARILRLP